MGSSSSGSDRARSTWSSSTSRCPAWGGEETFRQLRLLRPDVRVVLASGYSEQEATSQFAGKGLAGFIEKPFRAVDLLAKLQLALQT